MFWLPIPTLMYMCEIYMFPGSVCLFAAAKYVDRHMSIGTGTFPGIYKLHFRYSVVTLKKKLTENSASLTGCNRLTCKGDGKLFRHEDRVNPTSSDDEDGIFRNHRNFLTVFCSPAKEFSDNFPSTFRLMNHQK
jgi:hypothetical protein